MDLKGISKGCKLKENKTNHELGHPEPRELSMVPRLATLLRKAYFMFSLTEIQASFPQDFALLLIVKSSSFTYIRIACWFPTEGASVVRTESVMTGHCGRIITG